MIEIYKQMDLLVDGEVGPVDLRMCFESRTKYNTFHWSRYKLL